MVWLSVGIILTVGLILLVVRVGRVRLERR